MIKLFIAILLLVSMTSTAQSISGRNPSPKLTVRPSTDLMPGLSDNGPVPRMDSAMMKILIQALADVVTSQQMQIDQLNERFEMMLKGDVYAVKGNIQSHLQLQEVSNRLDSLIAHLPPFLIITREGWNWDQTPHIFQQQDTSLPVPHILYNNN